MERFLSSCQVRTASFSLRNGDRDDDNQRFFANCCVMVEAPTAELADAMDAERSSKTEVIETIIELGREEGLFGDEMTASRLMSLLVGPLVFDAAFQDGIGDTIDERAEHLHGLAREAADRFLASLERTAPSGATV